MITEQTNYSTDPPDPGRGACQARFRLYTKWIIISMTHCADDTRAHL